MATRIKLIDLERKHILNTLRQCRGNRTHTARSLGISVRGLRIKLASYAEMGADVPPPATSIVALVKAVPRGCAGRRCVERTLRPPNLDNHVRSQLGLSLRIFYDAILCSPLPETMKALAADLDERSPASCLLISSGRPTHSTVRVGERRDGPLQFNEL